MTSLFSFNMEAEHHETSGELVMVIFILCLLVFILGVITFTHYIIEKPKKRKMLKALRDYLQRKSGGGTNVNSMVCSQNSLGSKRRESNPAIVVTDHSASSNQLNKHVEHGNGAESDPLLSAQNSSLSKFEVIPLSSMNSGFMPVTGNTVDQQGQMHKVTFNIGETIIEESPSQSEVQLNQNLEESPNEESLKTISHLLDDKPWLCSTSSQANLNSYNSNGNKAQSRSNSVISCSVLPVTNSFSNTNNTTNNSTE
jgi:hypothetical protein